MSNEIEEIAMQHIFRWFRRRVIVRKVVNYQELIKGLQLRGVLVLALLVATPAVGQSLPLGPADSPLLSALWNRGYTHCTYHRGLGGPRITEPASKQLGCLFMRAGDALPEQAAGGAPHRAGPPWNELVREELRLPESYAPYNDPVARWLGHYLTYMSTVSGRMAWGYLGSVATSGDTLALSCPAVVGLESEVTCSVIGALPGSAWRAMLPSRPVTGPCWFGACNWRPTIRGTVPSDGSIVWWSDHVAGEAVVSASGDAPGRPGKQTALVTVKVEDMPEPPPDDPPPPPPPDDEPEPEPDAESDACQDARQARELLDGLVQHLCEVSHE